MISAWQAARTVMERLWGSVGPGEIHNTWKRHTEHREQAYKTHGIGIQNTRNRNRVEPCVRRTRQSPLLPVNSNTGGGKQEGLER